MSAKPCEICGAQVKKPKRHLRWHKENRPIPGPPGPPGPMGIAGESKQPNVTTTWEDAIASLRKFTEGLHPPR